MPIGTSAREHPKQTGIDLAFNVITFLHAGFLKSAQYTSLCLHTHRLQHSHMLYSWRCTKCERDNGVSTSWISSVAGTVSLRLDCVWQGDLCGEGDLLGGITVPCNAGVQAFTKLFLVSLLSSWMIWHIITRFQATLNNLISVARFM